MAMGIKAKILNITGKGSRAVTGLFFGTEGYAVHTVEVDADGEIVGGTSYSNDDVVSVTVANTAEAYTGTSSAPVCVGTKLTFTDLMRVSAGSGILQTLKLVDTDNIKAPLLLLLFNQDMTNGVYTNKSAPVFNTDVANFAGLVEISTADYRVAGGKAFVDLSATSKLIKAVGGKNLYGILLTTGSATYTNGNALTLKLGAMRS